jgi:hypothetical protein
MPELSINMVWRSERLGAAFRLSYAAAGVLVPSKSIALSVFLLPMGVPGGLGRRFPA